MAETLTLDEHAERVKRWDAVDAELEKNFGPRPESVREVRDAYGAEHLERKRLEACVRELEAERDALRGAIAERDGWWRDRIRLGMCVMDAPDGPECWCGAPSEVEAGLCLRHANELKRLSKVAVAEVQLRIFQACSDAERQQRTVDIPALGGRAEKAEAQLARTHDALTQSEARAFRAEAKLARLRAVAEAHRNMVDQYAGDDWLPANRRSVRMELDAALAHDDGSEVNRG